VDFRQVEAAGFFIIAENWKFSKENFWTVRRNLFGDLQAG
jgi:hypothetical protein